MLAAYNIVSKSDLILDRFRLIMVVLRCSFALAFAVLAVQTSALLPQQPATKQSTITAIVEVPQSGKANSAAQKGCEELNKKVNTGKS